MLFLRHKRELPNIEGIVSQPAKIRASDQEVSAETYLFLHQIKAFIVFCHNFCSNRQKIAFMRDSLSGYGAAKLAILATNHSGPTD